MTDDVYIWSLVKIPIYEKHLVFELLKGAAIRIGAMNIDHWQYWLEPPKEKVDWVEQGLKEGEFFAIQYYGSNVVGMVRIMEEDLRYWGAQQEGAFYIHSLVIREEYSGKGLGKRVLSRIAEMARRKRHKYLRLDADIGNKKLCSYYLSQGFKRVGISRQPLGTYLLMQKEL